MSFSLTWNTTVPFLCLFSQVWFYSRAVCRRSVKSGRNLIRNSPFNLFLLGLLGGFLARFLFFLLNIDPSIALNFHHCLVLSGFPSSWVSLESKLCVCFQSFVFLPSASLFSPLPDVCVCDCKRTCASFVFLLNIPLMFLFIYLFRCLQRPFLSG